MNIGKLDAKPKCPQCGETLDGFACVTDPDFVPDVGCLTVCSYCFTPLEFVEGMKLRRLNIAELPEDAQHDIRSALRIARAVEHMKRSEN